MIWNLHWSCLESKKSKQASGIEKSFGPPAWSHSCLVTKKYTEVYISYNYGTFGSRVWRGGVESIRKCRVAVGGTGEHYDIKSFLACKM